MEQSSFELPRLDLELFARKLVDHRYTNLSSTDPVAQLRGQIPLDLLAAQATDALEQGTDLELGARLGKEHASRVHGVARIPFAHNHLIDPLIGTARSHRERIAHGPKAQQTDAKFPLQTPSAICLQASLDRVADMSRDVLEVRHPVRIAGNAVAIVLHRQIVLAVLAAARDGNGLGVGIDAVLDELRDGLERIALRERDDTDGIPIIADPQFTALWFLRLGCAYLRHGDR